MFTFISVLIHNVFGLLRRNFWFIIDYFSKTVISKLCVYILTVENKKLVNVPFTSVETILILVILSSRTLYTITATYSTFKKYPGLVVESYVYIFKLS